MKTFVFFSRSFSGSFSHFIAWGTALLLMVVLGGRVGYAATTAEAHLRDPELAREVNQRWAGEDLDRLDRRAQALRYYYQNPAAAAVEQEVAFDVQNFLQKVQEDRAQVQARSGEAFFKKQVEHHLLKEDLRHGHARLALVDQHYVIHYHHHPSQQVFIILRPKQNPVPGPDPLWPHGLAAAQLQGTHPSFVLDPSYAEEGGIFSSSERISLTSRDLQQLLANQVIEENEGKGLNTMLVLLPHQADKRLTLFTPGQVLPLYLPKKILSWSWQVNYAKATLFRPHRGFVAMAAFYAAMQYATVLGINLLHHYLQNQTLDWSACNYDAAKWTFIWGLVIGTFSKTYNTWLNRGNSFTKKSIRQLFQKCFFQLTMALNSFGGFAGSITDVMRFVYNSMMSGTVRNHVVEKTRQQQVNQENIHSLREEVARHPWMQKIYQMPGIKAVIDFSKVLDIEMWNIKLQNWYLLYFMLKMGDLDGSELGHAAFLSAIPLFAISNQRYFTNDYLRHLQAMQDYRRQAVVDPAKLQKMKWQQADKRRAAYLTYKRNWFNGYIWEGQDKYYWQAAQKWAKQGQAMMGHYGAQFLAALGPKQAESFLTAWAAEWETSAQRWQQQAAEKGRAMEEISQKAFTKYMAQKIKAAYPTWQMLAKAQDETSQQYWPYLIMMKAQQWALQAMSWMMQKAASFMSRKGRQLDDHKAALGLWIDELQTAAQDLQHDAQKIDTLLQKLLSLGVLAQATPDHPAKIDEKALRRWVFSAKCATLLRKDLATARPQD